MVGARTIRLGDWVKSGDSSCSDVHRIGKPSAERAAGAAPRVSLSQNP